MPRWCRRVGMVAQDDDFFFIARGTVSRLREESFPVIGGRCNSATSVCGDEVGVDGGACPGACGGGDDDLSAEVGGIAGNPDSRDSGETVRVCFDVFTHAGGMLGRFQTEASEKGGASDHARRHDQRGSFDERTAAQPYSLDSVAGDQQ